MKLRLEVDLIPQTQWGKNLRKLVLRTVWDKLRKEVYAKAGFKCDICAATGRLNCHEVWEYNNSTRVQTLKGFHAVCSMCHNVAHYGRSSVLAAQGLLDLNEVDRHFMKVNGVSKKAFKKHLEEIGSLWLYRSQFEWMLDYGPWTALLSKSD